LVTRHLFFIGFFFLDVLVAFERYLLFPNGSHFRKPHSWTLALSFLPVSLATDLPRSSFLVFVCLQLVVAGAYAPF